MEVKVYVEGVHRIVCGVTEKTTCQEVVIVLAQALGCTGRYTLREKFKEYERNVTPDEHLLESLEKYGEQAKEVQLTLKHIGPSLGEETNQPKAQMRRAEGTGRMLYLNPLDMGGGGCIPVFSTCGGDCTPPNNCSYILVDVQG
uniref:Ras association domain family member 11 n=1 Tax=Cyprinus carpio TaxID=7962 RepID=A0A8C1UVW6_CYPCA